MALNHLCSQFIICIYIVTKDALKTVFQDNVFYTRSSTINRNPITYHIDQ